jgi:hypothetical protein
MEGTTLATPSTPSMDFGQFARKCDARELDDACALFEISLSECSLLIAASGLQLLCDAWPAGT